MTRRAGKRGNGEGSVFRRQDGRWQGALSLPADGLAKPTRRTVYGRTQREVLDKLRILQDEIRDGGPLPARVPTVAEWGRTFLDGTMAAEVARGHNAPTTRTNYANLWTRHVEPDLGHLRLDQLTPPVLRQWLATKVTQPSAHGTGSLSSSTQIRIYAVLRTALQAAVIDGILRRNPLDAVKRPRASQRKTVPLTADELTSLIRHVSGHWLHPLVLLMSVTGARPGEALAAAWSDIDLDARRWHISRSITRLPNAGPGGGRTTLGVKSTKTAASDAVIALPHILVFELRRHRAEQARQRLATQHWVDPDLVFTTSIGSLLEPRNVLRTLKQAVRAAGITRNVRLHDFRHAAASALLAEGVDIAVTSKLLRHTRLSTTSDIYAHLLEEVRDEAADVMDTRFRRLLDSRTTKGQAGPA